MFGTQYILTYTLVFFISLYVLGYIFPEHFWSTHFAYFNSIYVQLMVVVVSGILGFKFYKSTDDKPSKISSKLGFKITILSALIFALLFCLFPIQADFYGDAYKFNPFLPTYPSIIVQEINNNLFNLKLNPWTGEATILALITYLAHYLKLNYHQAFIIFNAFWGGLFVFCWMRFIAHYIKDAYWKVILWLAGVTAPFMLIFYGHIEIYAPILWVTLLWITLAISFIKTEKKYLLVLLSFLFVLNLKLHVISVLFLPALLVLFWKGVQGFYPNWKQVALYVFVPLSLGGIILYFFVFKDHMDTRSLQTHTMAFEHLFLPLFSPDAPLANYNVLSFNHLIDFGLLSLFWSPIALFVITFLVVAFREKIDWNTPEIVLSGMCLILFAAFFFVVNPLLSMPIDWDLFSIPAPLLLVFVATLVHQIEGDFSSKKLLYAAGILSILCIPTFTTHQTEQFISFRLEHLAKHIYKTYYEWTAQTIEHAYALDDPESTNRITRGEKLLQELAPLAEKGRDYEYSYLLKDQGLYYLRTQKNAAKAIAYFEKSQLYFHTLNTKKLTIEAYLQQQQAAEAFLLAKDLVEQKYPTPQKSLRIGIHIALEALQFKEAYLYCTLYLEKWPDTPVIKEVKRRLDANENVRELKFLFDNAYRN